MRPRSEDESTMRGRGESRTKEVSWSRGGEEDEGVGGWGLVSAPYLEGGESVLN